MFGKKNVYKTNEIRLSCEFFRITDYDFYSVRKLSFDEASVFAKFLALYSTSKALPILSHL